MPDLSALLAAVLASPDAAEPRLVCGFPRKRTQDGFELVARLLPRDNDEPKPASVVLEHYVD